MARPRAVVVAHPWIAGELGGLDPWLGDLDADVVRVDRESPGLAEAGAGADLLVLMGSPWSWAVPPAAPRVADAQQREQDLLRGALAAGTPVLGICYGAQALAVAAGGTVSRLPRTARGWMTLDARPPVPAGPWMVWHEDAFVVPDSAQVLATAEHATLAFRSGRAWGVQFHLEVDPPILGRMGEGLRADPAVVAEMVEAAERAEPVHRRNARALLDAFWDQVRA